MPEPPDDAAVRLAPDWVCEVLSEHTEAVDRGAKLRQAGRESRGSD